MMPELSCPRPNSSWKHLYVSISVMQQQATMERLSVRGAAMKDTRQMLPLLGAQDVAIAGLAVALAGWHEVYQNSPAMTAYIKFSAAVRPKVPILHSCSAPPPPPLTTMTHNTQHMGQAHLFCGRCGASTASIQNGAKRVCSANPRHRLYPRTDPVVRAPPKAPRMNCQAGVTWNVRIIRSLERHLQLP